MAYRTFTSKQLKDVLGLTMQRTMLFEHTSIVRLQPSQRLSLILSSASKMAITTEKAVSEQWVSPILTEIQLRNEGIVLFSGEQLNVDRSLHLNGEIDFLFTRATNHLAIESPILCIAEAKIGYIDKGIPQAAAQMYAARMFNEKEGNPIPVIYGAVTDGQTWRFLKLEGHTIYSDQEIVYLDNLPLLLGTLQWIVDLYQ